MKSLRTYLNERFPIPVSATLAIATAAYLVGCLDRARNLSAVLGELVLVAIAFLSFMLRMRVTDEFKDLGHDNSNYPNRPVQRGAITKRQLITIGVISGAAEVSAVAIFALGDHWSVVIGWYLAVVAFSVLTRFEFFAKEFLERHFTLYFLVHQGIFLIYPIWIATRYGTDAQQAALGILGFVAVMAAMEIVRKYEIRRNPAGEVVADTYIAVWGKASFWILLTLLQISSAALFVISSNLWFAAFAIASSAGLILIHKRHEAVRAIAAVTFISQSVVMFLS
jgi:4-hydroxybenzoate polyprenyltransferase